MRSMVKGIAPSTRRCPSTIRLRRTVPLPVLRTGRIYSVQRKREPVFRPAPQFIHRGCDGGLSAARARPERDFHATVLRLAHTVGGLDQRTAFTERFGSDCGLGDALTDQIGLGGISATL